MHELLVTDARIQPVEGTIAVFTWEVVFVKVNIGIPIQGLLSCESSVCSKQHQFMYNTPIRICA
jgi:hypothetical protein